ncbi:hypothetical protein diail_2360 [Diaporthe ilicicola]|nr:hypothetical protein diail_2360 [Diaporthe ilicicola]
MVSMHKEGSGTSATWTKVFVSRDDYRDIMWEDLLEIAKDHWDWLMRDRDGGRAAYTDMGSCLVAALFLPKTSGGVIFLSTIPRGNVHRAMSTSGAGAWRAANTDRSRRLMKLDAEDGAEYLFETSPYAAGIVSRAGEYVTPDRDNPHSRMKIAVWGRHNNSPPEGQQIPSCSKCKNVADTLNVVYSAHAPPRRIQLRAWKLFVLSPQRFELAFQRPKLEQPTLWALVLVAWLGTLFFESQMTGMMAGLKASPIKSSGAKRVVS